MAELTKEQAISVLVQAVKIAQSKGAFTLDDAALVAQAIRVIAPQSDATQAPVQPTEDVVAE